VRERGSSVNIIAIRQIAEQHLPARDDVPKVVIGQPGKRALRIVVAEYPAEEESNQRGQIARRPGET
jgi:hypothetical protein